MLSMFDLCSQCCLNTPRTYHIAVGGPRYSGKTSIVQWLRDREVCLEDIKSTEGVEISLSNYEGVKLVLYDSDNCEEDFANAKWFNCPPNSIKLKQASGIIFVVDGSDVGRLPLAAKILRDTVEKHYYADVLLILVAKADLFEHEQVTRPPSLIQQLSRLSPRKFTDERRLSLSPLSPAKFDHSPVSGGGTTMGCATNLHIRQGSREAGGFSLIKEETRSDIRLPALEGVTLNQVARLMSHPTLLQKHWCSWYVSALNKEGLETAFSWFVKTLERVEQQT